MTGTGTCGAGALREDPAELFLVLWQARQTLQWLFDESLACGNVSQVPAPGAPARKARKARKARNARKARTARKAAPAGVRRVQPARVRQMPA